MPLTVFTFASYPGTSIVLPPGDPLWESKHALLALKGEPKWFRLPDGRMVAPADAPEIAIEWFSSKIASIWEKVLQRDRYHLVPVPDSKATPGVQDCRTAMLARAIAAKVGPGAVVADVLRWSEPMKSASKGGGTRAAQELYKKLVLLPHGVPNEACCVIVDDVITSGGHVQAAAARLRASGWTCEAVFCAGETVEDRRAPFGIWSRRLGEYDPETGTIEVVYWLGPNSSPAATT